ncbi:hypothetical protein L1O03_01155 [Corynebacterium uropygiale]|uniref:Polysaccharide biosynthesis protein n=1 Tax=Corynebacterium uropygiale TaxID=1775911 RepID=A0A9X1QMS2_9CORY|nr:hypothetical protein [Corynebacterium uropygiale]MCF4005786.1 hypothetical protein [Corynebacterium uropygiale]
MRWLSYATIFSAASGFIVISLAAWALGAAGADQFQAYWGLFFALGGCTDGLMQETTRSISHAREKGAGATAAGSGAAGRGRPWRLGGQIAAIAVAIVLLSAALWMPLMVESHRLSGTIIMALGLAGYIFQAVLSGVLSGLGLWRRYAGLLALDAALRLGCALVAWACGWGLGAFMLITVIGSVAWLAILALSRDRGEILAAVADVDARALRRRALSAMTATGASAALITGFPVFVQVAQSVHPEPAQATGVTVAGIILAVTLTRAPILVPLTRFQSALIVRCVENRARILQTMLAPVGAVLGVGLVGAVAAWLIGPWILSMLYGEGFLVPGPTLAVLTFASACTGVLMMSGAAALAVERHGFYVAGWLSASLIAFLILLLPTTLTWGVCTALMVGPLAGAAVHMAGVRYYPTR